MALGKRAWDDGTREKVGGLGETLIIPNFLFLHY